MSVSVDEKLAAKVVSQRNDEMWAEYANRGNLMMNNVESISRRMRDMSSRLFSDEEKMVVDILDVADFVQTAGPRVNQKTIRSSNELEKYLSTRGNPDTRFISICAPNSIKALKITDVGMKAILAHHNVGTQFLDLLLSFAGRKKESEVGPGSMTLKHHPDGSYEMQYRYSYIEEVSGSSNPWAIRQTGIYHRYVPRGPGSLWIFLHPRPNSTLYKRLEDAVIAWEQTGHARKCWEDAHILVLSSYFGDWRWYLQSLSAEAERIASVALSTDFSKEERYGRDIDLLQSLHNLQDKVLPLSLRLRTTLSTVTSLKTYYETIFSSSSSKKHKVVEIIDELYAYDIALKGHLSSVTLLEKRVQEILNLLGVALNLKNQATTVTISRGIWSLTRDTVDDSATVRLVTIVTLVYLPASFVASFLGMNLFSFQTAEGTGFQISEKFWIFALLATPLTLITVGSWIFMARKRKRLREHERERQALAGGWQQEV